VEPAQALVPVAVSAQVPAGVVSLARAQVLDVAAEPVQAVLVEASVPGQVQAQARVLPVYLELAERGRQAEQPQAEAGSAGSASTWAAYPWVYQPEVFFPAQVFLSMTPRHSLSAETPGANRHRHKNG